MSSTDSDFPEFIQARDVAGLKVFLTNEFHYIGNTHRERNNIALFEACRDGADEICEVLISFGADVNYVVDQRTPLYVACCYAHPACVDVLLAHGADANSCNFDDIRPPLMATADPTNTVGLPLNQFIGNCCQCMHSLLDAGAAIDQRDYEGWTALMYATWNFSLTEILVKAGADVNILNNNSNSALHYACQRNDSNITELLLERGADIDAVDAQGEKPLHLACYNLDPAVIDTLLRHCADIDIVTNSGPSALQVAMSRPVTSPNRVAVLQLMATCAQTRLEESSVDWIRLARNERNRSQIQTTSTPISLTWLWCVVFIPFFTP